MTDYISRAALKEAFDNADADVCESYPDGHCDSGGDERLQTAVWSLFTDAHGTDAGGKS